jgi:tRNA(fMet)-specific endonuclease VapC
MIYYMLDTNICIYLIKKKPEQLVQRIRNSLKLGIGISVITLAELEYGVQKSQYTDKNAVNLLRFLVPFELMPFTAAAAREYGILRADLERKGSIIGNMDMLIAAHALSAHTILVTTNEREFRKIKGLKLENWTAVP